MAASRAVPLAHAEVEFAGQNLAVNLLSAQERTLE
jgi:hypothetical protein